MISHGIETPDDWNPETGEEHYSAPKTDQDTVPSPSNPMAVARFYMDQYTRNGVPLLRHWRGAWMQWQSTHWVEIEPGTVRSELYNWLEKAQYTYLDKYEKEQVASWKPNRNKIANVLDALQAITHLPDHVNAPAWLSRDESRHQQFNAREIVATTNGLLHVTSQELLPHDPAFFNLVSVPFNYEPTATASTWETFLSELWPDESDCIDALQEYVGYVLSGRTDMQKALLMIGPTRSGKGTIARIMQQLIGPENAAGPTLASLATNFGLAPLLGKPLAVVSDARLSGNTHAIVERLLTITGEDTLTVDRKFREPWTGTLPARFVILSNELPNFGDASGAIAHRFIPLVMSKSFLGQENTRLTDQLSAELPGILNWALTGLGRLTKQGRFTRPQSAQDAATTMLDNASPMSAFIRDCCKTGPGLEVSPDELFKKWKEWCEDNERKPGNKQLFGRNLKAAVPGLRRARPRDENGNQYAVYYGLELQPDDESKSGFATSRDSSRLREPSEGLSRDESRHNANPSQLHESQPTGVTDPTYGGFFDLGA